ncbi:predicted protein [Aspergillus terreus NIH2624]|uniref:Uncharacterized protein n=1 Tax=Aspergillus terreus (strain NIH 2624 / FGSC A1156) TaxID=341663 RepID=Q0CL48_ASPTN|nr:uncharacterized protein ATEG_05586 [Aspergillus terreus NIH2624]EAU34655.1 predicted protein [Aspergillus terreus NIH2624]
MARLSMSIWAVAFFLAVSARALPVQQDDGQDQMMDPWVEFEAHALSSSSHMMDEINDDIDQKTKELQEAHDGDHGKDELYGTQGSHESDNKQKLPEIPPTPEEVAKAHHKQDGEDDDSEEQKPSKDNDKKADGPVDVHVEKPHHDEDAETPAPKPEDKPEEKPKDEKPKEEKPTEEPAEEHKEEKPHSAIPSPTSTPTPTVTPSPTAAAVPTPTPTKKGLLGSLPIAGNLLGKLGL